MRRHGFFHTAASMVLLAVTSACANPCCDPSPSITIIPTTATIAVGRTTELSVSVTPVGSPVSWSSDRPDIATVSTSGLVTAISRGSATIVAVANAVTASAVVTVTAPAVRSIMVDPPALTLAPGQSRTVSASVIGTDGASLNGIALTWTSTNPAVATVSSAGVIAGVTTGVASVLVTAQGIQAALVVTVQPGVPATVTLAPSSVTVLAGRSQQVTATIRDSTGNVLSDETVLWHTSDPSIASVSASGMVTGIAAGTALLSASAGNQTSVAAVTVTNPVVATVTLSPIGVFLTVGGSQQIVATAQDAAGDPIPGQAVTWISMNTTVATVSGSGTIAAVAAGTTSVVATIAGRSAAATVTIANVPVASVTLSMPAIALTVGGDAQLVATPRDAAGNPLVNRPVTWRAANPAIAAVSASGVVTAVGAGNTTITATVENRSATATVSVTDPAAGVASVSIAPAALVLTAACTATLTADVRNELGQPMLNSAVVWSSSAMSVATVSQSGVVQAVNPGSAQIIATIQGHAGFASLTVQPPASTPGVSGC